MDEFEERLNNIQAKIGEEAKGMIADEIGLLMSYNSQRNTQIKQQEETITKLKQDKENLITVNGNLLQQVAMGEDMKPNSEKEPENNPQSFNFNSVFDEKGNFIN